MELLETLFELASSSIVKKQKMADKYETTESVKEYNKYEKAFNNFDNNYSESERQEILDNYEELNDYYRLLNGKPPYGEEGVLLDNEPNINYNEDVIEGDIYLCNMSNVKLNMLSTSGVLDELKEKYPNKRYLNYLLNPIPYNVSRNAQKFDLIATKDMYANNVSLVSSIYDESYNKVKNHFLATIYDEYYHFNYDYYEDTMVNFIILASVIESINQLNLNNINIATLSSNNIKSLFEDYGLPSNFELPSNLASSIANSLNDLIRHKGSKKAILDITEIFNLNIIYRYYLHKRQSDNIADLPNDASMDDKYTLEFVKVPFGEKDLHTYLKDRSNVTPYDDFISSDDTWSENIKTQLYDSNFSFIETKYMSVEDLSDITNSSFKTSLFFQHFFKNDVVSKNLYFNHRFIDGPVSMFDLLVYLTALMISKRGYVDEIYYDYDTVSHLIGLNDEFDEEEIKHELRYMFNDPEFVEIVSDGVNSIDVTSGDLSIENAMGNYVGNLDVIYYLENRMENVDDYKRYKLIKYIYDSLTIVKANNDIYDGAKTYTEYLRNSNLELYERLRDIVPSIDAEGDSQEYELTERDHNDILDEISYIIEILEDILSFFDNNEPPIALEFFDDMKSSELDKIKDYLFQVVNFFKSHTNYLMDLTVSYRIDDTKQKFRVLEELEIQEFFERDKDILGDMMTGKILFTELPDLSYNETYSMREVLQINDTTNKGGFDIYES